MVSIKSSLLASSYLLALMRGRIPKLSYLFIKSTAAISETNSFCFFSIYAFSSLLRTL